MNGGPGSATVQESVLLFVLAIYNAVLIAAYPFLRLYFLWQGARSEKFTGTMPERFGRYPAGKRRKEGERVIWVHTVSVGEAVGATKFIRLLLEREKDASIVVTTATKGGMNILNGSFGGSITTAYFPFDFPWVVRRAIKAFRPSALILMETEIWPNLTTAVARRGAPVILLNGRVSDRMASAGAVVRAVYSSVFGAMRALGMQTEEDAARIVRLGAPVAKTRVVGNMKFDAAPDAPDTEKTAALKALLNPGGGPVLTAGSAHPGEEAMLLDVFARLRMKRPELRLLLAPRHIERASEVLALARASFPDAALRSSLTATGVGPAPSVVVMDTIGELRLVYGLSTLCFVGGSLVERGGHNILEPAACGKAAFYGPHMMNFIASARALEAGGGGVMVKDSEDLFARLSEFLGDEEARARIDSNAFNVIMRNAGATERAHRIFKESSL